MVSFANTLLAALAGLGAVQAAKLHVNRGCIIADNQKLCAGAGTIDVIGMVNIDACIDGSKSPQTTSCHLRMEIPYEWQEAFFGADNCLYSAGSPASLIGCAYKTQPQDVPNVYRKMRFMA